MYEKVPKNGNLKVGLLLKIQKLTAQLIADAQIHPLLIPTENNSKVNAKIKDMVGTQMWGEHQNGLKRENENW